MILCNFLVRRLQYFHKYFKHFFAHENMEKLPPKVAHNRPKKIFPVLRQAAHIAKSLISISEIELRHPLLYLHCELPLEILWFTQKNVCKHCTFFNMMFVVIIVFIIVQLIKNNNKKYGQNKNWENSQTYCNGYLSSKGGHLTRVGTDFDYFRQLILLTHIC